MHIDGTPIRALRQRARVVKHAEGVDPEAGKPYEIVDATVWTVDGQLVTDPERIAALDRALAKQKEG